MIFAPLFSGSGGNAIYVAEGDTHLLVDAGISGTRIAKELCRIGADPARLSGILITHEHTDHISGAGVLSRKYNLPVYATVGTWRAMREKIGAVHRDNIGILRTGTAVSLGGITVLPFPISHDAEEPVGYSFTTPDARCAVATDTGEIQEGWISCCEGADLVLLESNYDPGMLRMGPYPYDLKRRIMGNKGHLSNEDAGAAASRLIASGVKQLVLGHLSRENNFPELALRTVTDSLIAAGQSASIDVARRDGAAGIYELRGNVCAKKSI